MLFLLYNWVYRISILKERSKIVINIISLDVVLANEFNNKQLKHIIILSLRIVRIEMVLNLNINLASDIKLFKI